MCDALSVSGADRNLLQESACLGHGLIWIVGGEHDAVDASQLEEKIKKRRREVHAGEGVVNVFSQIGLDRTLQPGDCHWNDIEPLKKERQSLTHMTDDELQFRKMVEHTTAYHTDHVDGGFDVQTPGA